MEEIQEECIRGNGMVDFYTTAQAIGLPIEGDRGTLSNAGPVLKNNETTSYGVNLKDNWRGRHNSQKTVKIYT